MYKKLKEYFSFINLLFLDSFQGSLQVRLEQIVAVKPFYHHVNQESSFQIKMA